MKTVKVFLLDKNGDVQYCLNWGQREDRDPNEAYLQLTPDIYKGDFFPPKGKYFVVDTDDNKTFIMSRAQKDKGTALQIPDNNALLGEYLRERLGVPSGAQITKDNIENSGLNVITFLKKDDMHFLMTFGDISPRLLRNSNVELLSTENLIDKVRKSFTHFIHLVNSHTKDFTGYIAKFEEFINPRLTSAFPEYTNIFQIVDINVLRSIVSRLKELDPSLEKVFTEDYSGTQYQSFRTMKYYEIYLDILADSDFRTNIEKNKEDRLAIPSIDKESSENNYLRAIRTKPFLLLAGISGTGKSRIVRKLAQATVTEDLQKKYDKKFNSEDFAKDRWELHRPANFELIQVKPNWHNSMDVVGYLSNIPSPHYVFTPFIHFIIRAWQNPEVPFFLCLDEMNLAPVEEYFAEFLSAIESRDKQNGQYVTDPIIKPFKEFGKIESDKGAMVDVTTNMLKTLFPDTNITDIEDENLRNLVSNLKTKGLTLPPNLIVIGTVNMDETTFSFSRKVLDRAMSIEMNDVDYDAFVSGDTDKGLKELADNLVSVDKLLVDRPIQAKEVLNAVGDDAYHVLRYLKKINTLLEGTPFKLGYRAANEAILYLNASYDFGNNNWREAMDQFTLMKILSRIEGDSNKLKIGNGEADQKRLKDSGVRKEEAEKKFGPLTLLTAIRVIIEDELKETGNESKETDANLNEDASLEGTSENSLPKTESRKLDSIRKLDSMISQLERERFVSYWN